MKTICVCGGLARLQYKNEQGRIKDKVVTIYNVPVYYCADCQEAFTTGPDSLRFAQRVRKAIESGAEELEF